MADNTVTLILDGVVPFDEFAKGIARFSALITALSGEVAQQPLRWILDDLQYSSAVASARAEGSPLDVSNTLAAYEDVGASLEANTPINHNEKVSRAARSLVDIGVERIRLETAKRESLVNLHQEVQITSLELPQSTMQIVHGKKPSFGGIKGRIQTLTSRGGLRFTLFDIHQDKAVSCYFEEGKQDLVRDLWGRMAFVEGMITRDPLNGRPLAIRGVKEIHPIAEPTGRREYQQAMGAAPSLNSMSAEEAIRRVRDAQ